MMEWGHVSEQNIEAYSLGQLNDFQQAELEEHLLICPFCRYRLSEWDAFHSAIRSALKPDLAEGRF